MLLAIHRHVFVLVAIACGIFLEGCQGGATPVRVHPVSGTLSVNGQPVSNIIVHFVPGNGRPSTGVTDAGGKFDLQYEKGIRGVVPGEHKVWIEYKPGSPAEEMAMREGKLSLPTDVAAALKKYGALETSSYTVTVDGPKADLKLDL